VAAGFSSTLIATMLGAGGGLIGIPILHYIFMQMGFSSTDAMIMTAGTASLSMVMSAPRAMFAYMKRDQMDWDLAKQLFIPTMLGCMASHMAGLTGSGHVMQVVFAVLVTVIGIYMLLGKEYRHFVSTTPSNTVWWTFAFFLGMICPLVGIGGAVVAVPFMTAMRVPIRKAIGTSAVIALAVGVTSFLPYMQMHVDGADNMPFTIGAVHIVAALLFFAAGYLGQPLGLYLQNRFTGKQLRRMFATVLFISAARFFWLIFTA
jgi:uncharacterized membrane protein YfcA